MKSYSTAHETTMLSNLESVQIDLKNLTQQNKYTKAPQSCLSWHNLNVHLPQEKPRFYLNSKLKPVKHILKNSKLSY